MCEIENGHTGRQRATPESCDHQRRTHLNHTTKTKSLHERADEGTYKSPNAQTDRIKFLSSSGELSTILMTKLLGVSH